MTASTTVSKTRAAELRIPQNDDSESDWEILCRFITRFDQREVPGVNLSRPCWIWTGTWRGKGYGSIGVYGMTMPAHRVSYALFVGPIPDGLTIDHRCRQRRCVQPSHLEPVTNRENILRGTSFSARHAAQTHCKHGHEFTEENTRYVYDSRGRKGRQCRKCRPAGPRFEGPRPPRTHCKHGHELTPENTYHRPDQPNSRKCRTCGNAWTRAWRLKTRSH